MLDLLDTSAAHESLKAMYEAGINRLPFEHLVVEWDTDEGVGLQRNILWIFERDPELYPMRSKEVMWHPWGCHLFRIRKDPNTNLDAAVLSPSDIFLGYDPAMSDGYGVVGYHYIAENSLFIDGEDEALKNAVLGTYNRDAKLCIEAVSAIMLMMHTKGVSYEKVEHHKFNKARVKSGKTPTPAYTVISIGQVFNAKGVATTYDPGNGGSRKPMRVHLRRGHTKRVRHGAGRKETKIVFIEP